MRDITLDCVWSQGSFYTVSSGTGTSVHTVRRCHRSHSPLVITQMLPAGDKGGASRPRLCARCGAVHPIQRQKHPSHTYKCSVRCPRETALSTESTEHRSRRCAFPDSIIVGEAGIGHSRFRFLFMPLPVLEQFSTAGANSFEHTIHRRQTTYTPPITHFGNTRKES